MLSKHFSYQRLQNCHKVTNFYLNIKAVDEKIYIFDWIGMNEKRPSSSAEGPFYEV